MHAHNNANELETFHEITPPLSVSTNQARAWLARRGFQTRCFPWLLLPTPAEAVLGIALHACLDDEAAATAARPTLRRRF